MRKRNKKHETCAKKDKKRGTCAIWTKSAKTSATWTKSVKHAPHRQKARHKRHMDKQRETCAKKRKKARNLRHRDKKRETCATGTKSVKHAPHRQKVRNKCHRGKKREACTKKDKKHETKDNSFSKAGVWLQEEVEMDRFLCAFFYLAHPKLTHMFSHNPGQSRRLDPGYCQQKWGQSVIPHILHRPGEKLSFCILFTTAYKVGLSYLFS